MEWKVLRSWDLGVVEEPGVALESKSKTTIYMPMIHFYSDILQTEVS